MRTKQKQKALGPGMSIYLRQLKDEAMKKYGTNDPYILYERLREEKKYPIGMIRTIVEM